MRQYIPSLPPICFGSPSGGRSYLTLTSFRLKANNDQQVSYEFSLDDGKSFTRLGPPAKLRFSWWKGARPALFSFNTGEGDAGHADFDWLHVESPQD